MPKFAESENYRQCNYYYTRKRTRRFGLVFLILSSVSCFVGVVVCILENMHEEPIAACGVWGSVLGFVASALCYFATKPNTNRIPLMRAHMSMVVLNGLIAAVAISVIALYHDNSSNSEGLIEIVHLVEVCGLSGLILASLISFTWFILYHFGVNFKSDPIQLGDDEIVIRNAAGDTVIISMSQVNAEATTQAVTQRIAHLPSYDEATQNHDFEFIE